MTDSKRTYTLITLQIIFAILAIIFSIIALISLHASTPETLTPNYRTARREVPVIIKNVAITSRESTPLRTIWCEITAYSPTVAECDSNPTRTASGKTVYVGGIAADLRILPFGSKVIIPGYNGGNPCTVIDTGGAIKGNKLDVFMWSAHEAIHWGRRKNVPVTVVYIPKEKP